MAVNTAGAARGAPCVKGLTVTHQLWAGPHALQRLGTEMLVPDRPVGAEAAGTEGARTDARGRTVVRDQTLLMTRCNRGGAPGPRTFGAGLR
jgi:hypothetical protein